MKKLIKIVPIIVIVCLVATSVFAGSPVAAPAASGGIITVPDSITGGSANSSISTIAGNAWSTVITIVQMLAVAAVVFAGLKYMFAGADQKADIKKGLGILAVGAILVFAASTVLKTFVSLV